jgi:hypothetical protein
MHVVGISIGKFDISHLQPVSSSEPTIDELKLRTQIGVILLKSVNTLCHA